VIGLRRSGLKAEAIEEVRWVYKTLYRRGLSLRLAIEALRERAERPMIAEYLEFIETSKRGICPGVGSAKRSAAVEAREE
jgi:UDP-N-acetylglucosamine acyltransferase